MQHNLERSKRTSVFVRRTIGLAFAAAILGTLTGAQAQLAADGINPLQSGTDRPVVLLFVTTECPVSNRYAPEIQRLATKYSKRADFWLVYADPQDTPEQIATHLKEYSLRIAAVRDPGFALAHRSHARVTPEAALFDRNRNLVYHGRIDNRFIRFGTERPSATQHDLDDAVQEVLDGKPVKTAETPAVGCYIADLQP